MTPLTNLRDAVAALTEPLPVENIAQFRWWDSLGISAIDTPFNTPSLLGSLWMALSGSINDADRITMRVLPDGEMEITKKGGRWFVVVVNSSCPISYHPVESIARILATLDALLAKENPHA